MRTIDEILDKIKELKGVKTDTELSKLLKVKPNAVTNWRKRRSIPYDRIVTMCEKDGIPLGLILFEDTYRPFAIADPSAIYNVRADPELAEIVEWLKERPKDKKLVLKLIKVKKDVGDAFEGLEFKIHLKEES